MLESYKDSPLAKSPNLKLNIPFDDKHEKYVNNYQIRNNQSILGSD